jgi:hypothetical protein
VSCHRRPSTEDIPISRHPGKAAQLVFITIERFCRTHALPFRHGGTSSGIGHQLYVVTCFVTPADADNVREAFDGYQFSSSK